MHKIRWLRQVSWSLVSLGAFCSGAVAHEASGRDWTAHDSISVRLYSLMVADTRNEAGLSPIVPSPDGRFFFVESIHSEVQCDCVVQTLEIFDSDRVASWLKQSHRGSPSSPPGLLRTVQMRTHMSTSQAISTDVHWTHEDGTESSIVFVGKDAQDRDQIYRIRVPSGQLDQLTDDATEKYFPAQGGRGLIYRRNVIVPTPHTVQYPVVVAPRNEEGDVEIPFRPELSKSTRVEWVYSVDGEGVWTLPGIDAVLVRTWFSPDGRRAVVEPVSGGPAAFLLMDAISRKSDRLAVTEPRPAGGTAGSTADVIWSADGQPTVVFHSDGVTPRPKLADGLAVRIRQSANDPPSVIAADGSHEATLSLPDPALQGIWRARVTPFTWQDSRGEDVTGGVALPRVCGDHPSLRERHTGTCRDLPLVIQAYHYDPDIFLPDGPTPTAYAMQALVSQGFAVLAMNIQDMSTYHTPSEGVDFVGRLDSAVEALAARGLVDRDRVAVIGFSHAGYDAFYALTHPGRIRLAAAEIADSVTYGYPDYLGDATSSIAPLDRMRKPPERMNGGDFWHHKSEWLEHDPYFNVDRVTAPTLFVAINSSPASTALMDVTSTMEIGAFQLNHKPFEYLFFPTGIHTLNRPLERIASMEATVDWMAFWILNREIPDAGKGEQYARWRLIKKRWEHQQAQGVR